MGARAAEIRVGVVGTGFISRHFLLAFDGRLGLKVTGALTRRDPAAVAGYPRADLLTRSRSEVLDGCDVLLECSGDPVYATDTIDAALRAGPTHETAAVAEFTRPRRAPVRKRTLL